MSLLLTTFEGTSHVRETASKPRRIGAVPRLRRLNAVQAITMLTIATIAALAVVGVPVTIANEYHSNPWLLSWIPAYCCVTNDCCWEVAERDLDSLPDDKWQVKATGQVRERTNWSPDGKFYRCACDYDSAAGLWVRHIGANTRCLFVPMRSAALKMKTG
jgi:hypothetical protein